MKKRNILIPLLLTLILFCSCSETVTYKREINRAPSLEYFTIEDLLEESDVIAEIEVMENIGETNDPDYKTFFQADVITVIKGDKNMASLKFMQGVNSEYLFEGYPIFEAGQKLVLFLKSATGSNYPDDMYWINGDYLSVIKIHEYEGTIYAKKLIGSFRDIPAEEPTKMLNGTQYKLDDLVAAIQQRMD